MKKSTISKLILLLVIFSLILALAACNGTTGNDDDDDDDDDKTPAVDIVAELVDIIKGIDGHVKTINGVTADSTLSVKAFLDLSIKSLKETGATATTHSVGLAGNIKKATPELSINYELNDKERFALGFKSNNLYLKQPINTVNTDEEDANAAQIKAAALAPAVADVMEIVMDALANDDEDLIPLDFDELAEGLRETLALFESALAEFITITKTTAKVSVNISEDISTLLAPMIRGAIPESISPMLDSLVNSAFGQNDGLDYIFDNFPALSVDVSYDGVNAKKIDLVMIMENEFELKIGIGIDKISTESTTSISFSGYKQQLLQLGLDAEIPGKNAVASMEAFINPDFSAVGNNLGVGSITFGSGAQTYVVPAYFNGTKAVFDLEKARAYLGATWTKETAYTATIKDDGTPKSIVAIINDAAAEAKENYFSDEVAETTPSTDIPKSLNQMIFEILGGTLVEEDGAYVDISEAEVIEQLDKKVAEHVVLRGGLKIYDSAKNADNSFGGALKRVTNYFDTQKTWIIGAEGDDDDLGIFNWDSEAWKGGIHIYQDGEKNDLLDVVNAFIYYKENANDKTGKPFTVEYIVEQDTSGYARQILGYATDEALIAAIKNDGVFIEVSCEEGEGLNGTIKAISTDGADIYASITGRMAIIDYEEATVATPTINEVGALELNEFIKDGKQAVDEEGLPKVDKDDNPVMEDYYKNAEQLIDLLEVLRDAFFARTAS